MDPVAVRRPVVALLLAALGAGCVVGGVALGLRVPADDAGTTSAAGISTSGAVPPSVAVPTQVEPSAPTRVQIGAIGVVAAVRPVQLTADGALDVPADPAELGWWSASAPVGAASGTTVVDGHVDSATAGIGALFRLSSVNPGDRVVVGTADGAQVPYRVVGRHTFAKADGLPANVFDRGGPPRLVLITCGGSFDRATGSYRDNVVVYAVRA